MKIEVTVQNSCVIVKPQGDLDSNSSAEFSETLKKQIDAGIKTIIIDFSNVDFLASAGIGVLAEHYNKLKISGGEIRLAAFSDSISKVLTLLGFTKFFPTFTSVEDALKSVKN